VAESEDRLTTEVGYMPQSAFALNNLTVRESLYFAARFRGHRRRSAAAESERLTDAWGLAKVRGQVAKQLSGGERRLLQLAVSMAGSPPVLILDEPTANLDPVNRGRVWDLVERANRSGSTVIFVTHDALEAEKVLQRVAVLRAGRLVAIGPLGDMKRELDNRLRLELTWDPRSSPRLPECNGHAQLDVGRWRTMVDKAEAGAMLASVDLREFTDVRLASVTLEDLYLHHAAPR
jgi:ABC-2 type transport system ATP-binding protein/ABC-2 type transport system permease protein